MKQIFSKSLRRVAMAAMTLAVSVTGAEAAPIFTDWTALDLGANTASGSLGGATVTLQGGDLDVGIINDSSTVFSSAQYTPALALSDTIGFRARATTPYSYGVTFSAPVTDLIIHIVSVASTLIFTLPDNTPIPVLYVSGNIGAGGVVGNSVIGQLFNTGTPACVNDRCGTVKLIGTFTAFNFSALYHTWPGAPFAPYDGIGLQIGAESVTLANGVAAPGALPLLALGLFGLLRRRTAEGS